MNRLLLSLLLIGIGIYIYIVLYKYDNEDDEDEDNHEYQTVHKTRNVNNINKLKGILKHHNEELINDNFIEHKKVTNTNNPIITSINTNANTNTANSNTVNTANMNIANTNIANTNTVNTNPINTSDKHVHFSEQNDEFVFSANLPIVKDLNNSELDDIFIKPNIFVEPYNNDYSNKKNINLTLSENEYFSKVDY
jgi:hypothetical protein